MVLMSSFFYFFKESLRGFSRNLSTALGSIVTIFLSLLIIGVFLVGGAMIDRVVRSVESEVSITAYLGDNASQQDIQKLKSSLASQSGVAHVDYISKEGALEKFREMNANSDIANQLGDSNPLPASITISLSDPKLVETIAQRLAADDTFKNICDEPANPSSSINYGQKTVERLFSVTSYIRYIGVALVALLIFIALIFINNTIRLAILARRKEISIMRLVGASNGFIRGPFLMEGALHALIGSLLAVVILEIMRRTVMPGIQSALAFLALDVSMSVYAMVYVVLVLAGLIIGLIGSSFAMRRYLKV